jgi:hypothetical protein
MPNHFTTIGLCGHDWKRMEILGVEPEDIDLSPLNGDTGEWSQSNDHPGTGNWEAVPLTEEEQDQLRAEYGAVT